MLRRILAILAILAAVPVGAGVVCSSTNKSCGTSAGGGGGPVSFPTITSGTNTAAAMLVGTGASLGITGTGTIAASTTNIIIANEGVTGTTANYLAKLTGAPSTAIVAGTSDTSGIVGVVVSGAGTTGSALIARSGSASCAFDGATTAGDYVIVSTTAAGKCHDTGAATYPSGNIQVLGRVLSTNVGAGTYAMTLHMGTQGGMAPLSSDGTNITLASGQLLLPAGTAALPSLAIGSAAGIYQAGVAELDFGISGSARAIINATGVHPGTTGARTLGGTSLRWSAGYFGGNNVTASTPMLDLAQTQNSAGVSFVGATLAYTETATAAGSRYFQILGGAAGTTDEFWIGKGGTLGLAGSLVVTVSGGTLNLGNSGGFNTLLLGSTSAMLQLGGTTSSFPALKRVGATMALVFADDTGPLTNATMTAENRGLLASSTSSYTWTNAQVVAALGGGTTGDITVATLPAKTQVIDAAVVITGAAAGPATLTVACGRTGATYIDYIVASDAKAAANTVYGDASAERGTNLTGYDLPSYTGTTTVTCHFVAADTTAVTSSTGRVILTTRLLP